MRAAVTHPGATDPPVSAEAWPDPDVPAGWVLVRLERAALNRNDRMTLRDRGSLPGPAVIGSDGAGVVAAVGAGVRDVQPGAEVVLLPSLWWGGRPEAPGEAFEILGFPTQGTHAELVAVPAENVFPRPRRLGWDEAAALPLAGVTAWRALVTRGRLAEGETVVVTAASSGVGTFAIPIAHALGAQVVAVSSSEEKLEAARALGAASGVLRTAEGWTDRLHDVTGGVDLVLDSAGAEWQGLLEALRPGGRLVSVGRTAAEQATVAVHSVFWKQVDILGSSMGSPADFAALLDHVERSSWVPQVDSVVPLSEVERAYARLDAPGRVGKVVLDVTA